MEDGIIRVRKTYNEEVEDITAEDMLEALDELSNKERKKFLDEVYNMFFTKKR
ncbi:hypothetical protein JI666_20340 [Bacillus sp. NTK071]|uniref:hypothetical protein n=1 Tax=Bacillus sp. NTK071 TaxID=2802175 RepID=UPI001A8F84C9|nr:hypothetical protein [Bacillus sp. NTK071]MBN8211088.1 hypothetical protein [Bacillus sp. NTK071]